MYQKFFKFLAWIILCSPYNNYELYTHYFPLPVKNWGLKRLNNFMKVTQLGPVSAVGSVQYRACNFNPYNTLSPKENLTIKSRGRVY